MGAYFDDKVKTALNMQCGKISASDALKQRIDGELLVYRSATETSAEREIFMENSNKRKVHFSGKKLAIGIAAACLLISGMAFAGRTAMYKTSLKPGKTYHSYAELDQAKEKLGHEAEAVESFDNGYRFQEMDISYTDAADENGKAIYTFPELWIRYGKEGAKNLSLVIDKPIEKWKNSKSPDLTSQYGDVEIRYDIYTYKFVPEDYELTAEDEANMERPDYEISVGSDQVEIQKVMSVNWEKDGVHYNLFGYDLELSGEEMIAMAEEILEENQ